MSNNVLIVQNISHEGPGLLLDLLLGHHIDYELYDLSTGRSIPDPRNYACMVILGGPQSANDLTEQITHELSRVREALDSGIPCLGICLGLQLLVKASGGAVTSGPVKETGFFEPDGEPYTVTLTNEGRGDRLFDGLPDRLRVFQLHGETVVPTEGMTLLGTGKGCRNQVLRVAENAWGLQCHFEMTRDMFETWTRLDHDLMAMDTTALLGEFDRIREEYTHIGRTLLLNFLRVAGLVGADNLQVT